MALKSQRRAEPFFGFEVGVASDELKSCALARSLGKNLPASPDDPRLKGWYHTIELGHGLVSKGFYDHRSIVDRYGLPESLRGKTALDVGTCNGFWAFEMERRGADRVVAIDVARWGDFDWLPWVEKSKGRQADRRPEERFKLARAMRGSSVEHKICNVYDLSPQNVGTFDVVFCGSLLLHLHNPFGALLNICSVTKEMAIVATQTEREINQPFPDKAWLAFGHQWEESTPGEEGIYWRFSTCALRKMMDYAGFGATQPLEPFHLPPTQRVEVTVVIGHQQTKRIKEIVRDVVPAAACVLVVSHGDPELVNLPGREAWHFPRTVEGLYAGHYPADGREAITWLEELRHKGAQYLLFPGTGFWWLEHYPDFADHLSKRYKAVWADDACKVFHLFRDDG
jgi:tRNA (mo5U34)-methyltransferase